MNKILVATYAGSGLEISQCSGTESMSDWRGILRTEDIKFVRRSTGYCEPHPSKRRLAQFLKCVRELGNYRLCSVIILLLERHLYLMIICISKKTQNIEVTYRSNELVLES